jgi:hypothetical protein
MSNIDFETVHQRYYNNLKQENPDKEYCIMCFDEKNIVKDTKLCADCTYIVNMLKDIKKI